MQIFIIGPKRGKPQAIGLLSDKETLQQRVDKLQVLAPERLTIHHAVEVEKDLGQLALRIVGNELASWERGNGWYDVDKSRAELALAKATRALSMIRMPMPTPDFAGLIKFLRTEVFKVSQPAFALIAGVSVASSVSRWESGDFIPDTVQLQRIRAFANIAGLPWDDSWIVNPPAAA